MIDHLHVILDLIYLYQIYAKDYNIQVKLSIPKPRYAVRKEAFNCINHRLGIGVAAVKQPYNNIGFKKVC